MLGNLENTHLDVSGITLPGKDQAIVCLHGFTATPQTFSAFSKKAQDSLGFHIYAPLLAGHGRHFTDLNQVRYQDWINQVHNIITDLEKQFSKIHLVGLSLGGMLACFLSLEGFKSIQSISLMAPGLYLANQKHLWQLRFLQFLPKALLAKKIYTKQTITPGHISYDRYSIYAANEIFQICKHLQKNMTPMNHPFLIQYPKFDPVVDPKSSEDIFSHCHNPASQLISFDSASHIMVEGENKVDVFTNIIDFIKTHS